MDRVVYEHRRHPTGPDADRSDESGLTGGGDQRGDLGSGVGSELIKDAADVAVDGALRYEQPRSDLLVAQSLGDQPGHVGLALPEQGGGPHPALPHTRGRNQLAIASRISERVTDGLVAAQAFSGVHLRLELRGSERLDR